MGRFADYLRRFLKVVAKQQLYYLTRDDFRRRVRYTRYFKKTKIKNNMILYESFHGAAINDNPYAIFKYIIKDPQFQKYVHVWVLNDDEGNLYAEKYRKYHNVTFVKVNSRRYLKYLTEAKYLINSVTFPPYFQKKKGQIYVNTWHGTPLKTLGKDMKGDVSQLKNIQRNFLHADFILSPNEFTTKVIAESHDLIGIFGGKFIEEGYPRIDQIRNTDKDDFFDHILSKVVNLKKNKKTVLYAPTWRGEVNDVADLKDTITEHIKELYKKMPEQYQLILKVHSLIYKYIQDDDYLEKICIPNWVDTNELMTNVDVIVTDYSSIFFDFLVTGKPIIFFNYDEKEYVRERGIYLDLNSLPGPRCFSIDEVIQALTQPVDKYKEAYHRYKQRFCSNDLSNCTQKYVDAIFNNDFSGKNIRSFTDHRKNILMYCGGFLNNGITSSAINLSYNIDYSRFNLIVIDKGKYNEESEANIRRLDPRAKILYRVGGINTTLSEWYIHGYSVSKGNNSFVDRVFKPQKIYQREIHRLLGIQTRVDVAIDFSGYVPFWTLLMGYGKFSYKSIYQHNDMLAETKKVINGRLKHEKALGTIFTLYKFFDRIISVGKETRKLNAENLKGYVDPGKIVYVPNSINSQAILDSVNGRSLPIERYENKEYMLTEKIIENGIISIKGIRMPQKSDINFVTMGRLSPEKDQSKLIRAFDIVERRYSDKPIKLYIIGSGVLEQPLKRLAESLNPQNIFFTGQLADPYRLINECSCFVLSSNHEGQPMVLLEAMVMGKPIISTDIAGSRSVLGNTYGKLVANSVEGLVKGMSDFINNDGMQHNKFDYKIYNKQAMELFYQFACGDYDSEM